MIKTIEYSEITVKGNDTINLISGKSLVKIPVRHDYLEQLRHGYKGTKTDRELCEAFAKAWLLQNKRVDFEWQLSSRPTVPLAPVYPDYEAAQLLEVMIVEPTTKLLVVELPADLQVPMDGIPLNATEAAHHLFHEYLPLRILSM